MTDPRTAARTMIERANSKGIEITNLKLQKLLYLAHGMMLARYEEPLVNECFQAWRYGPVVESLYHDLKLYGPGPIAASDSFIGWWDILAKSDARVNVIDDILAQFGGMSGGRLINLTHDVEGPWHAVFSQASGANVCIPDEEIKRYFKTRITEKEAA